jgi:hypothetical protein
MGDCNAQWKSLENEEVLCRRKEQEALERKQRAKEYLQRAQIARQRILTKVGSHPLPHAAQGQMTSISVSWWVQTLKRAGFSSAHAKAPVKNAHNGDVPNPFVTIAPDPIMPTATLPTPPGGTGKAAHSRTGA